MESIAILLLFTTQYYMKPIKLFLADKTAKIPSWCRKFCPPKFCPILGGGRKLEGPKKSCFFLGGRKFKGPNWEKVPENQSGQKLKGIIGSQVFQFVLLYRHSNCKFWIPFKILKGFRYKNCVYLLTWGIPRPMN